VVPSLEGIQLKQVNNCFYFPPVKVIEYKHLLVKMAATYGPREEVILPQLPTEHNIRGGEELPILHILEGRNHSNYIENF